MLRIKNKGLALVVALCLIYIFSAPALAATEAQIRAALDDTAAYICKTTPAPQVGSVGGEWAVIGLARSGYAVPDGYFARYYAAVEQQVWECKGVLHERKYSEYSRVVLGLTAIGHDATDVAGYDLTAALGDYEQTVWQGLNGPVFALLALDSGDYPMPMNSEAKTQASREMFVQYIISRQLADGGFSQSGVAPADPDATAMALQALARYQSSPGVAEAIEKALACLSAMQDESGGLGSCESAVQAIVALNELGISMEDSRFVKNGRSLADALLGYYIKGGGFKHTAEGGSDAMASEQGLYALASLQRAASGLNTLYDMSDAMSGNEAVTVQPVQEAADVNKAMRRAVAQLMLTALTVAKLL